MVTTSVVDSRATRGIKKPELVLVISSMAEAAGDAPVDLIPTFWLFAVEIKIRT